MRSYDEIIHHRSNEIFNEVQDIDRELREIAARAERLTAKKEMLIEEHQMLQNIQDKGLIASPGSNKVSRMKLEDALKRIFDRVGRPMSVTEIFEALREFQYQWSTYHAGYQRLFREMDVLESTGARGYYQLRK